MFWRRLIKWLAIVLLVLAVALLVIIWPILGVNPFEGRIDNLWLLTSNEVDFFVRFPATTTLDSEPLFRNLEQEPAYSFLADMKEELAKATLDVAREVNPQIPLGLVEVDLEQDFLGREMALAGVIQSDFKRPRLDNFIFLTRVEFYGRFLSALKRGFVRNRLRGVDIELVRGLYFRLRLAPRVANALRPYRSARGRPGGDTTFYLARIADVVLFSDSDRWIEHALTRSNLTIQADAWFDSEFIRGYRGGSRIEMFVRPTLTAKLMFQHAPRGSGGVLGTLRMLLPPQVMGELTLRLKPRGRDELTLDLSNVLANEGFEKLPVYLQALYDSEKGDARFDLSENGIGRFIPSKNVVGAIVFHARPEDFVGLAVSMLTPTEKQEIDEHVREVSRRRRKNYPSFRKLMEELTSDLGTTHLLVIHRPTVFEGQRYERFDDDTWPPLPNPEVMWTLVSSVKESVRPDQVRENIFRVLEYVNMKAAGPHKSGDFHLAELIVETGDERLKRPAYGVLGGGKRFIVFSSHYEAAEAVYETAENPEQGLLNRPGMAQLAGRLPRNATMAMVFDGATLREALFDWVRRYADSQMNLDGPGGRVQAYRNSHTKATNQEILEFRTNHILENYPRHREAYDQTLSYLDPVDAMLFSCTLGVGSEKKVEAGGVVRFRGVSE